MPVASILLVTEASPNWASQMVAIATLAAAAIGLVTFLVVVLTALMARRQLGDARRTRHGQLITDLSKRWDETMVAVLPMLSQMTKSQLTDLVKRVVTPPKGTSPASSDVATYLSLIRLPDLVETIGVVEADGGITLRVVHLMWGSAIRDLWAQWEEAVGVIRASSIGSAGSFSQFKRLANELEKPVYEPVSWWSNIVVRRRVP